MPPHRGHQYLVDFARHYADELTVVVGSLQQEPIPGVLRWRWMQELFPQARVVHLTDENPQWPHQHPDFWSIWKTSLERIVDRPIDVLFASEDYGIKLAETLGARYIPTNGCRQLVRISASQIRENPMQYWEFLPDPVRPYFVRRISVFGPESTGKTTLTQNLARHYQTLWVPEYAREWLEPRQGQVTLDDMPTIFRAQRASQEALARQANRLLFCDTDPSATQLWSQELFGLIPTELQAQAMHYDLTLLCDVDVPWVDDCVRYRPENRQEFHHRCKELLQSENRRVVHLRGDWSCRWQTALEAVESVLHEDRL